MRHALLFLVVVGCSHRDPTKLISGQAALRWPPAPQPARVRYVGQIRGVPGTSALAVIVGEETARQLARPYAVTLTPGDVLAVTDLGNQALVLFDLVRGRQTVVTDHHGRPLRSPVGVAADAEGRIYVADADARRVFVFSSEGKALHSFGGRLRRPAGVAIDREREVLYVADAHAHRIHARHLGGRYLFGIGERGSTPGKLSFPTHLAFDARGGQLIVCDTLNYRVQIMDRSGRPIGTIGQHGDATGSFAGPKGVAVDSAGHVYVADALFNTIQVFDQTGRLLLYFGVEGKGAGELEMPTGLYIDDSDRIFVGNTLNGRVEVFRYLSKPTR